MEATNRKPSVSVIIPIYNVEKYLRKCLDSVINQTLKDIEIICINDGSTDSSGTILDEYAQKDTRIRVVHKNNEGYGKSMNLGLSIANGEYIGIVEPDDFIDTGMYEKLYTMSQNRYPEIVKSNFYKFDEISTWKINKFSNVIETSIYKNIEIPQFVTNGHPCIWTAIYKKDFLDKYSIRFSETPGAAFQDVGFNVKTWLNSASIAITEDAYYNYRADNMESSVNKGSKMAFITLKEYSLLYDYIKNNKFSDELLNFVDYKCVQDIEFNYHTRLKHNHLKFTIHANKLFNMHKNSSELNKNKFYHSIKKHPLLFFIKTFFYTKKEVNPWKKKYYICRIPLFTISENETQKTYRLLFFKIKIKKFSKNITTKTSNDDVFFNLLQDRQIEKYIDKYFDLENDLKYVTDVPSYLPVDSSHNYLNILLGIPSFKYINYNGKIPIINNTILNWEIRPIKESTQILKHALNLNKKVLYVGDSFLRSINTHADADALPKYQKGISFTFDDLTCYFDATRPSRMEQMLNNKNLIITEEQKQRARQCINKIIKNHLTKYNYQPIFEPKIGQEGRRKVLVVDQSYGDMSITKGLANDKTFKDMLNAAILENPDADIIVKTHPDTIARKGKGGYYTGIKEHDNIYTQTEPINPISLITYCDKVYVCSTQFGFEALMCEKEVHVFGMPFYAGWGLTKDRQHCERRTNTRTLEEVFYIAYILYSYYINPITNKKCEIEEAMDYLLKLREEYFSANDNIYIE